MISCFKRKINILKSWVVGQIFLVLPVLQVVIVHDHLCVLNYLADKDFLEASPDPSLSVKTPFPTLSPFPSLSLSLIPKSRPSHSLSVTTPTVWHHLESSHMCFQPQILKMVLKPQLWGYRHVRCHCQWGQHWRPHR